MILFAKKILQRFKKPKIMLSEYQMVKQSVLNKGYVWRERGDFDVNIIWVRMSDHVSNMMDDKCYINYKALEVEYCILVDANTKPALYGALYNPVTVGGITGTACIIPQQVLEAHKYINNLWNDTYNPWNQPYFLQVKPLQIWRDNDKDDVIDHMQEESGTPSDGLCIHIQEEPLSTPGKKPWSLGCIGLHKQDFRYTLDPVMKKRIVAHELLNDFTLILNTDLIVKLV